jgi:hypothetical protein
MVTLLWLPSHFTPLFSHFLLQEDDRSRRLEALRANDFEAYQELLKQQQVRYDLRSYIGRMICL